MRRALLPTAAFLAYLMVPGAAELTEYAVHWMQHGDSAHADSAGHEQRDGTDEHGCSDTFHLCLCHHASGFVANAATAPHFSSQSPVLVMASWCVEAPRSIELSDIFRPPIA